MNPNSTTPTDGSNRETETKRTDETTRSQHLSRATRVAAWLDRVATGDETLAQSSGAKRLHERAKQMHGEAASLRWLIERERARS